MLMADLGVAVYSTDDVIQCGNYNSYSNIQLLSTVFFLKVSIHIFRSVQVLILFEILNVKFKSFKGVTIAPIRFLEML